MTAYRAHVVGMLVGSGVASVRYRAKNVSMHRKESKNVYIADSQEGRLSPWHAKV
jgi:hypothetical protein